jgi:hypothetical protein
MMDDAKRAKYEQALEVFVQPPRSSGKHLMTAICLTQLGRYSRARQFYYVALHGFLKDRRGWYGTSQPNWLVDTHILAHRPSLYPKVRDEIEAYKRDYRGDSLMALYSYALVCLVFGDDAEAGNYVNGLLKRPKIKDTFAMGQIIEAISVQDQPAFDTSLDALLQAHRGMAKFGGLRETPEGFLCLPAMSLSRIALEHDMAVNVESEYLSRGYLDYLLRQQDSTI